MIWKKILELSLSFAQIENKIAFSQTYYYSTLLRIIYGAEYFHNENFNYTF